MSGSQKALKVVSILLIIYAVVMTAFGIFLVAGGSFLAGETIDVNGTAEAANVMAAALGGGTIVGGIVDLVIGLLGLRGAKNPRKVGPFFVLCIIGLVLGLVGLGLSLIHIWHGRGMLCCWDQTGPCRAGGRGRER